jgi:peptide/nickel transport system substrate-binding protein
MMSEKPAGTAQDHVSTDTGLVYTHTLNRREMAMIKRTRSISKAVTLVVIATWLLAGCATGTEPPATPTAVSGPAPAATDTAAPPAVQEQPTEASGPAPALKNPDTFIYATNADAASLDPAWLYDISSANVVMQVYEPLLFPKKESTTEFVPLLATKWDISSDGKTYTFTIRKGVKFHEGQDLTPEDVAYSFWRGLIQDRSGGPQWILLQPFFGLDVHTFKDDVVDKQHNKDWVAACGAVKQAITFDNSAGTVTMHLKQAYGPMLQILSTPGGWTSILSKSWVASQKGWDGDCANAEKYHDPKAEDDELTKVMNGTGPYKFVRRAPGEETDLARNDNYWLKEPLWDGGPSGPAKIERVVFKVIPEWGTRLATFKTGDADLADVPRPNIAQVDPLVKESCPYGQSGCAAASPDGFLRRYTNLPDAAASLIALNQKVNDTGGNSKIGSGKLDGKGVPPDFFADIHVRKAFNYCFDWDTFINQVYNGEAAQALGPVIQGHPGYDSKQAHYSLDLNKCAEEFKAAGLKSPDGKSLWDTGFLVQLVFATGEEESHSAAEILKANLAQVNSKFKLDIVNEEWPALLKDMSDSRLALSTIGWIQDFNDPHDWALPYLGSGGAFSGFQNFPKDLQAQLDQLILEGAQATDQSARAKIYAKLQNMSYENALDIFTVQPLGRRYFQSWVQGWYYNQMFFSPGLYVYVLSKGQ